MLAYVLDNRSLRIKDILDFEEFDFKEDIGYSGKSAITVARKPDVRDDDFVVCKDGDRQVFTGICESFKGGSGGAEYSISLLQKECLFDRQIFVGDEGLIAGAGIEDFIAEAIRANFSSSGDPFLDKAYISVSASTHTPIAARVEAQDGVYNLKDYLGNARQYYGIFLEFTFAGNRLEVRVEQKREAAIPIDIETSDISDYTEVYSVQALASLAVRWKTPDGQDSDGNAVAGTTEERRFFLRSDLAVTEESGDPERAAGITKSMYIEAEREEEMLQKVCDEFASNRYSHKISFRLNRESRLYPVGRFYVGRLCTIKTKSGVRTSIVTQAGLKSDSSTVSLTLGNLKVTLIEKLRGR